MAWERRSLLDKAEEQIKRVLSELKREEKQLSVSPNIFSKEEWCDFIADMRKVLDEYDKKCVMSLAGDQFVDIQRDRLQKIEDCIKTLEIK